MKQFFFIFPCKFPFEFRNQNIQSLRSFGFEEPGNWSGVLIKNEELGYIF